MGTKKRFLLQLDEQLYQILEKWSADELTSVNAQIEYPLADAVKKLGVANNSKLTRPMKSMIEALDRLNFCLVTALSRMNC